jgi:hypothetical protein
MTSSVRAIRIATPPPTPPPKAATFTELPDVTPAVAEAMVELPELTEGMELDPPTIGLLVGADVLKPEVLEPRSVVVELVEERHAVDVVLTTCLDNATREPVASDKTTSKEVPPGISTTQMNGETTPSPEAMVLMYGMAARPDGSARLILLAGFVEAAKKTCSLNGAVPPVNLSTTDSVDVRFGGTCALNLLHW